MRYFSRLAYNGSRHNGWQSQPNAPTIQEAIETALSTILRTTIRIVGCGRTDSGVHAKDYAMHFDFEGEFPKYFLNRVNKFLPKDIVIKTIEPVDSKAHARFDATSRSYEYHLTFVKNPFNQETSYYFPFKNQLDIEKVKAASLVLLNYKEFFPFCKTNHDANTMFCTITRAEWILDADENGMVLYVTSNRFLRGMIRLIVGMSLNVGLGKLSIEEVKQALEDQTILPKSHSVPPEGLFLTDIIYES